MELKDIFLSNYGIEFQDPIRNFFAINYIEYCKETSYSENKRNELIHKVKRRIAFFMTFICIILSTITVPIVLFLLGYIENLVGSLSEFNSFLLGICGGEVIIIIWVIIWAGITHTAYEVKWKRVDGTRNR